MTPCATHTFTIRHPEDPARVIRGKVTMPTARRSAASGLPHVVLLHGFKGFMDWGFFPDMAERIASRGIVAVRFNASGSGVGADLETFSELEAFERNTLTCEMEDIASVRDWIRDGGVPGIAAERAVLVGHSRGGGLALVHAAERDDVLGVVTWATVATFDRFDAPTKELWRRTGFLPIQNARTGQEMRMGVAALEDLERHRGRFDVVAAARRLAAPVLLVHGSADESVPVEESELLFAALEPSRRTLLLIEGAGHTFGIRHPMTATSDAWSEAAEATLSRILDLAG